MAAQRHVDRKALIDLTGEQDVEAIRLSVLFPERKDVQSLIVVLVDVSGHHGQLVRVMGEIAAVLDRLQDTVGGAHMRVAARRPGRGCFPIFDVSGPGWRRIWGRMRRMARGMGRGLGDRTGHRRRLGAKRRWRRRMVGHGRNSPALLTGQYRRSRPPATGVLPTHETCAPELTIVAQGLFRQVKFWTVKPAASAPWPRRPPPAGLEAPFPGADSAARRPSAPRSAGTRDWHEPPSPSA